MPRLNSANNAETTLAVAITATDTTLTVEDASLFPDAPFRITVDAEIMEVGAIDRVANTFTSVDRALEGTPAAAHSTGASVQNRFTAGTFNELISENEWDAHIANYNTLQGNFNTLQTNFNSLQSSYNSHVTDYNSTKSSLSSHTSNKSNPHGVTASQTGALAKTGGTLTGPVTIDSNSGMLNLKGNTTAYIQLYKTGGSTRTAWIGQGTVDYDYFRIWGTSMIQLQPNGGSRMFEFSQVTNGGLKFSEYAMLKFTMNEIQARNDTDDAYIRLAASAFEVNSERSAKQDIDSLQEPALDLINQSNVYQYLLKSEVEREEVKEKQRVGIMLDEAPGILKDEESETIDLYSMTALAWKAIQELTAEIKELKGSV